MKHELARIYQELSAGKLSQQQALDKIKTLKASQQDKPLVTLLASPVWESPAVPQARKDESALYGQQHIILCDLPHIVTAELESLISEGRCTTLQTQQVGTIADVYTKVTLACFERIRRLLQGRPQGYSCVQLVIADNEAAHLFAGLAGLFETATLENPAIFGQILFVRPDIPTAELAQCLRVESNNTQDTVVRYSNGARLLRHWKPIAANQYQSSTPAASRGAFKEQGVYLITGGLGGLGILFAQEVLNQTSAVKIILINRTEPTATRLRVLESLRQQAEGIDYRQVDVTDPEQVEHLFASIAKEYGQLNGIIHGAGIVLDDFILNKSSEQFTRVLLPKVAGTYHLDSASREMDLDFFLLFSSIASWAGNVGQADYAAANGFIEQFANYRNALVSAGQRKGKTLAISWPHWLQGGMHVDPTSMALLRQRTGLGSLETEQGMDAFYRCLALPQCPIMVMRGDEGVMRRALDGEHRGRPETETAPMVKSGGETNATDAGDLVGKTREFLCQEFSTSLKIPISRIDTQAPLEKYGIDSILAMDLTNQLETRFGTLAKTLFFEYLTIDELADYFVKSHTDRLNDLFATKAQEDTKKPQAAPAHPGSTASWSLPALQGRRARLRDRQRYLPVATRSQPLCNEPIAIVGLSGRYPESWDLEAFWNNLRDGKDCIVEIPKERWDWRQYYTEDRTQLGRHYSKRGGFIAGVDEFDPRFFNISPREAHTMDPQERLFLQHAWMAIEDAGYTRASLQIPHDNGMAGQVGVYAGVMYGEYNLSGTLASIANRVSYFLNLHGPSLTLDTMCSSSLTAIHLACQDLRLGRTGLAIAGGVNVSIHPNKYTMLSGGQFISSDGHCQSFGEGGDGYIPGEGVGVAILKRQSDAERDGNHIYGLIRGSALNHGGKTNGYTVPNPHAQADVIRHALSEAGVVPRHISYIEAHGTGTKLGDPIEIAALTKAFYADLPPTSKDVGFCRIGSAKSNIGHCESAAGIAGVTKVLLQMKHTAIVASLHSRKPNPHIDFAATPFIVNQSLTSWEQPELDGKRLSRIAGVSSFGAGGANAHLIIEEYRPSILPDAPTHGQVIVPLSARTAEQLRQRVRDLVAFIERSEHSIDLGSMAYTLQVGREAMEERAAFLAISSKDLIAKLKSFLYENSLGGEIYHAQVREHKETLSQISAERDFQHTIEQWIDSGNLPKLAEFWVKGLDVDWRRLMDSEHPVRLMNLPTYPFARESYWVEPLAIAPETRVQRTVLHPLVHENTSSLAEQGYTSRFTGNELFLEAGMTEGQKLLPPLLVLEMIRAAVELASPKRPESGLWELEQTVWGEPIRVSEERIIGIALLASTFDAVDVEIYSESASANGMSNQLHCQSHALFRRLPAPAPLDIPRLKAAMHVQPDAVHTDVTGFFQGDRQALAEFRLPARSDQEQAEYPLHADLLKLLAQLLDRVTGQSLPPADLKRLRIIFACPDKAVAWLRYSSCTVVDIDICDEQGNVCLQLIGLRSQAVAESEMVESARMQLAIAPEAGRKQVAFPSEVVPTAPTPWDAPASAPTEISFAPVSASEPKPRNEAVSKKPTDVRLLPSATVPSLPVMTKATVALSDLLARPASWPDSWRVTQDSSRSVRLFALSECVFSIDIEVASVMDAIEPLLQTLSRARQETTLKVLLLIGRHPECLQGDRRACNQAIERGLLSTLAAFPYPVIAALPGNATGAGLLLGAVCDFLVHSEEGQYGYTNIEQGIFPSAGEDRLFRERLGEAVAEDFLYRSTRSSGRQLKERGWACRILPAVQVEAEAKRLAADLARKSQLSLGLLKTHLGRHLQSLVEDLVAVDTVSSAMGVTLPSSGKVMDSALVLRLGADRDTYVLQDLIADVRDACDQVSSACEYKSLVLASVLDGFLPQPGTAIDAATVTELKNLVRNCPVPVIAAFESDAHGLAWLFGLFCDISVYKRAGRYRTSDLWITPWLAQEVAAICTQHLGASLGQEVCLTQVDYSGADLEMRMGALRVVDGAEVMTQALQLAAFWDQWPRQIVTAWKQSQTTHLQSLLEAFPHHQEWPDEATDGAPDPIAVSTPTTIDLRSTVVAATAYPEGVVVISMQEREEKNMFSQALVSGLREVFAHIEQTPTYKVVVLSGYDSYFATGGTRETLLAIQEGRVEFTDETVFQLPLDCPLPVVAAIQGHGVGGGWSFGMFADLVLLSKESRYLSPYMDYGFTPGAGATLVFPKKIGYDLARETLLGAQQISGHTLQERRAPLQVLPRHAVVSTAIELAKSMARHPRTTLINLKRLWTHALRGACEDTYRREVDMHQRTFVKNTDALDYIQAKFPEDNAQQQAQNAKVAAQTSSIVFELRGMLAQELFLRPEEIDEDAQFIDLGLDSITGVTWIRKINAHYGTDIEATKIYSHPTLAALSQLVARVAAIEIEPTLTVEVPQLANGAAPAVSSPIAAISSSDHAIEDAILGKLRAMLAQELHLRPDEIEETAQFIDIGLDSITGVTWVRKINEHYGTNIEATKVYSHPTLAEISHLVKQAAEDAGTLAKPASLQSLPSPAIPNAVKVPVQFEPSPNRLTSWRRQEAGNLRIAPQVEKTSEPQPIAVIGVAGQFPKAKNIQEFWTNLADGRNCVDQVPDARWNTSRYYQEGVPVPGKAYSKWLGCLEEYDLFDPLFFNISPTEAECMDPQQRVFLHACWHSIENAGYNPQSLSGSQCGVFVGCGSSDYHQASREQLLSAQGFTGAATSILAARISYFLNLRGPCIALDTACSSSLVAIATACNSLNTGNSDLALAGGVYVMAGPAMHIMTSQAGMLSADGRCFSFDQRANGFVPGEGVGVVLLKRLADADRDQDRIQAVIEGWGVNQDGKTNGITAPNEEAQARLLQSVYGKFDIDPAGIQLIEAHGTGTKLGDPIEVAGLQAAFKPFTDKSNFCALGSVKSNIGHCLTAAGVAGFIKLILALQHRSLPPTINFERCNEHIQLDGSPFYINDSLKPWNVADGERRRAAISSFGFSGTNAHIVIAEHQPSEQARAEVSVVVQDAKIPVPLSARTEPRLRQQAENLLAYIRGHKESLALVDVAYTLQVGREPMGERLGFLVGSLDALTAKLAAYVAGESGIDDVYQGQVKRHKEGIKLISEDAEVRAMIIEKWLTERKLSNLLELWTKGLDLDWNLFFGETKPQRIELPGYPFAKDRFWIDVNDTHSNQQLKRDVLHPLLHKNVSLLSQQRYCSNFSGEEFFFNAAVNGARVMFPSTLLEIARAAVEHATTDLDLPGLTELSQVSWEKPLVVAGDEQVFIDLFTNEDESIAFEIYTIESVDEADSSIIVHARGIAYFVERGPFACVDIEAIRDRSTVERFNAANFYADLKPAFVHADNMMQCLITVYHGNGELLGHMDLSDALNSSRQEYVLHPSLIEGAVQACMVFLNSAYALPVGFLTPISIDSLTVVSGYQQEMFAWVRYPDHFDGNSLPKLDIDILDMQGNCCVLIRGLTLDAIMLNEITEKGSEVVMMVPRWDVINDFNEYDDPVVVDRTLVINANDEQNSIFGHIFRDSIAAFIDIEASDTVADIKQKLEGIGFDKLVWIASARDATTLTEESIVEDQDRGILQLIRITRSLTELGYEKRALQLDLITLNSLMVKRSDLINVTHAGLQGFSGSMAEVYPNWKIRLFDLQTVSEAAVDEMYKLPFWLKNACYAFRDGEWFFQKLIPVEMPLYGKPSYRPDGIYVVIGGTGGLGEIWTRHVIEHYQANVIWIGRRKLNDDIQNKIDKLAVLGKAPQYIQADARNLQELQAAYEHIKRMYPTIHGIIHSAVGAFDQSLGTVSEADFRSILSVKIDLSVRIAQVFEKEALDFVLFFSSDASFVRGAGMSGYSAGCSFKDAFALQLAKLWPCVVKVINWGYWSAGTGETMSERMKTYLYGMGYRPIDMEEGMKALHAFLASDFNQMSISRIVQPAFRNFCSNDEWITSYIDDSEKTRIQLDLSDIEDLSLSSKFENLDNKADKEMEDLLCLLLRDIVDSIPGVLPAYDHWLMESKNIVDSCYRSEDHEPVYDPWEQWNEAMQGWLQDSGRKALYRLVDQCIRALPDILAGKQKATNVIFPESSLKLVGDIYKTDRIWLAYNKSLGEILIALIKKRLKQDPEARIRLLEIGAGTGATTEVILKKLEPYQIHIDEYCYTDISKAFLLHAEGSYMPNTPYLRTQIFDVEKPIVEQNINLDSYDYVIAANVIHVAKNVRNALRNAKAVLHKHGILLLQEISDRSIFGHITFGLLDGWWRQDDGIRIPGCPGLYPEAWREVMEEEGFHSIQFPCNKFHAAGQQIILATSDGIVRQKRAAISQPRISKVEPTEEKKIMAMTTRFPIQAPITESALPIAAIVTPNQSLAKSSDDNDEFDSDILLKEKTVQLCKQLLGKSLKISSHEIDASEPLENYGIDSIVISLVNQDFQKYFNDIGSTLLYEFNTIDALSAHLVETQKTTLENLFGVDRPARVKNHTTLIAAKDYPVFDEDTHEVGISDDLLWEKTIQFCKKLIGEALNINIHQIDPDEPLESYGIDSIVIGLVNQHLQKYFGDISSTLLFEFQTVKALSQHLFETQRNDLERLFKLDLVPPNSASINPNPSISSANVRTPLRARSRSTGQKNQVRDKGQKPIAIIGISGLYPNAASLEEFWENLKSGKNCITEVPRKRWSLDGFYEPDEERAIEQEKSYCKWGGFVDQFAEFDTLFFSIPPREALIMDPQERMFLQCAWRALENSGYTRSTLKQKFGGKVGVFAGITRVGYNLYRTTAQSQERFWPRTSFSSVANRLSYFLDINGPSLPVDTMCSSSLTAIHEASAHLYNGDCDIAFAGGVNLYLHPTSFVDMSSQRMLSKDGMCKSFGADCNGFVPGEGVGVVLLKLLDRALADKDIIHGLILATHVNHGGKTNGFTVPNPVAQAGLIRAAIDKAGISARDISYIEAHGTGTELGDPIEITGLQQSFSKNTQDTSYCRIGSVKSNIGHLEAAAGIAGLTKVLLQLKHQKIVPSLHSLKTNPHINFSRTPFIVNQKLVPWEKPLVDGKEKPRIAGISSFGAGGANAHVIVQEFLPATLRPNFATRNPREVAIIPLSAKTTEQLEQRASDLFDFLSISQGNADLNEIAYTLQVGREAMEERAAFIVDSMEQLVNNLKSYICGEKKIDDFYLGQSQNKKDSLSALIQDEDVDGTIEHWINHRKYSKLVMLWVDGLDFDWTRLYGETKPQRIELPTYPFAEDEYWLDSIASSNDMKYGYVPDMAIEDYERIEDIITKIDEDSIDAGQGIHLLRKLI